MNTSTNQIFRVIIILLLLFIIFNSLEYLNYRSTFSFIAATTVIILCASAAIYVLYKIFKNKINQQ